MVPPIQKQYCGCNFTPKVTPVSWPAQARPATYDSAKVTSAGMGRRPRCGRMGGAPGQRYARITRPVSRIKIFACAPVTAS
jgi:hypothetical protein